MSYKEGDFVVGNRSGNIYRVIRTINVSRDLFVDDMEVQVLYINRTGEVMFRKKDYVVMAHSSNCSPVSEKHINEAFNSMYGLLEREVERCIEDAERAIDGHQIKKDRLLDILKRVSQEQKCECEAKDAL